jgi:hypothetical protein
MVSVCLQPNLFMIFPVSMFYEYFHGDNGAGIGASHQTGWTGLVAALIEMFGRIDADQFLAAGKKGAFAKAATSRG